jgi:hypothetical protein
MAATAPSWGIELVEVAERSRAETASGRNDRVSSALRTRRPDISASRSPDSRSLTAYGWTQAGNARTSMQRASRRVVSRAWMNGIDAPPYNV